MDEKELAAILKRNAEQDAANAPPAGAAAAGGAAGAGLGGGGAEDRVKGLGFK